MRPDERIGDRFTIEHRVGAGGMGEVFRARDDASDGPVAIKVMRSLEPEMRERFVREARVLAALSHPVIARYVAHGTTPGGEDWLAMEWLEGERLDDRLAARGLTVAESARLIGQLAQALGEAHPMGIVHRDIKPANIVLLDGDVDRARLLDFGIARLSRAYDTSITRTGAIVGTPGYMAPEQARGDAAIDGRADLFALGALMYRCLTGRDAFEGGDALAVMMKVVYAEPTAVRDARPAVPESLAALCAWMMAKEPAARPPSAEVVAREIAAIVRALASGGPEARVTGAGREALTAGERRVQCIVVATPVAHAAPGAGAGAGDDAVTVRVGHESLDTRRRGELLERAAARHGARLATLADGTLVASFASEGIATDQAARAARCALALQATLGPKHTIVVAAGRAPVGARVALGEALDRGAALLRAQRGGIRLDDAVAGLLDQRFELGGDAYGLCLRAERDVADSVRTLLGRPSPCVGRERDLASLLAVCDESAAESVARAAIVTAPAGGGKSRVRFELLRALGERRAGTEVWLARADLMSEGTALGLVALLVRRAAGVLEDESPAVRQHKLRARVARHVRAQDVARVAAFLGEAIGAMPGEEPGLAPQLRAARADARLMGDQMRRAWTDFLCAEASAHPVVVAVEDLHWGDAASVALLGAALVGARELPLAVLGFGRPEALERFPRLWSEHGVMQVALAPLTRRASEQLVRATLGAAADEATVARVAQHAHGNPFYLEELIRAQAEGRGDQGLPATVVAMAQSRLESLDADARRALRAASVFGGAFWRGAVAALTGRAEPGAVETLLGRLAEREIVTRASGSRFAGESEWTFRHALVRDAAYETLTDEDRALGHRLAGAWLEANGVDDALALATHFERGGEPERAVRWYHRAADRELEANDFAAARARARSAAACGAAGVELGALWLIQALAYHWTGRNDDADRCAAEVHALVPAGSAAWWRAAHMRALSAAFSGHADAQAAAFDVLIRQGNSGPVEPDALSAALVACSSAATHACVADDEPRTVALTVLVEQFVALSPPNDRDALARYTTLRGFVAHTRGDIGGFLAALESAVPLLEELGDARASSMHRANLGWGYLVVGAYAEAERCLREGIAVAERLEMRHIVGATRGYLGAVLYRRGDFDGALATLSDALATLAPLGVPRLEAEVQASRAELRLATGDLDGAERDAREALERSSHHATSVHVVLARLALLRGDPSGALAEATLACAQIREREFADVAARIMHAEALHALGRDAEARAVIATATQRIELRAAGLLDPTLRTHYLRSVQENARAFELAARWARPA